jgi:ABC-2 type transport system permease protein
VEHHRAFATAAEQYRRLLVRTMNESMAANSRTGDWGWKADPSLWREVPPFDFRGPSVSQALASHGTSLWLLGGWLVLALVSVVRTRVLRLD